MNSSQKLYVTPEELARRKAEMKKNAHPHGGEGRCGGNEGHGAPELQRKRAEQGRDGKGVNPPPERPRAADHVDSADKPATKNGKSGSDAVDRDKLVSAMRLAFALSEPVCRRYGMPSGYGVRRF